MKSFARLGVAIISSTLIATITAGAHENHEKPNREEFPVNEMKLNYDKINEAYIENIRPIFKKKCFDCHSSQINEPWYRNLPGAKQLIDRDIREAKEHLNLDPNFPFRSHATPLEDLVAIEKIVVKDEMPPFRYWILNWGSRLTTEEKEKIKEWTQFGQGLLKAK